MVCGEIHFFMFVFDYGEIGDMGMENLRFLFDGK